MSLAADEMYADALARHMSGGSASIGSWRIRLADGRSDLLGPRIAAWCASTDPIDGSILTRCQGAVLDVGCGPGRFVAALARRGTPALGVDIAPAALRLARKAGAPVLQRSVFDALPAEGRWGTVLLIDGNIGIGGDPVRLLRRCRSLIHRQGRVLVELAVPGTGVRTLPARLECDEHISDWFDWAFVGPDAIGRVAVRAGMVVSRRWQEGGRWFAQLHA